MANLGYVRKEAALDDGCAPPGAVPPGEIAYIAQLACTVAGAKGCLVAFRSPLGDGCVWAAGPPPPHVISSARVTELVTRWSDGGSGGAAAIVHHVAPSDGAVLRSLGINIEDAARLTLWRHSEGQSGICLGLVSATAGQMTTGVGELAARCASALIGARYHSYQANFWRTQAAELRDNLVAARAQAARAGLERIREAALSRRLAASAERGNLRAVASTLSRLGPFEGWILATHNQGELGIRDVHGIPRDAVDGSGATLRRAVRQRVTVGRNLACTAALTAQDRLLRRLGYRAYLCLPLEGAVLLLLSRTALTAAARARVANYRRIVAPHLKSLFLSRELERQRALVRSLVRGLFATADAERATLHRDLHDDWAQLLAAAQIAIRGDREDAQRFFQRLEGEMRRRLDALRPPQSRQASLKRTIEAELQRLKAAGVEASSSIHGLNRLPATIKEVFARVIGEGVSNVIRHAGADRVHVQVACHDGVAVAAVTDNGRGLNNGSAAAGSGLRGLGERVALLGGRCKLDSKPGSTRLRASIPVADL